VAAPAVAPALPKVNIPVAEKGKWILFSCGTSDCDEDTQGE
jgi:hypothetical protein